MKYKRLGQTFLCLLLICALLVNVSPIRAEASVLGTLLATEGAKVVGSVLIGLGIGVGSAIAIHDHIAESALGDLISAGLATEDGKVQVASLGDGRYGVKVSLLDRLHSWIFGSELVKRSSSISKNTPAGTYIYDGANYDSYYQGYGEFASSVDCLTIPTYSTNGVKDGRVQFQVHILFLSDEQFRISRRVGSYVTASYGTANKRADGTYYYFAGGSYGVLEADWSAWFTRLSDFYEIPYISNAEERISYILDLPITPSDLVTDYDVNLGVVGKQGASIAESYPEWAANAITIPNAETGEDDLYYPIGSAAAAGSPAIDRTQEDIWKGTLPIIIIDQTGTGGEPTEPTEPTEPDDGTGTIIPTDPVTPTLLERLFGGVTSKIEEMTYTIQEIPEILREFALDVKTAFEELPGKFREWFDDICTKLQQLVTGQITLGELLSGLFQPVRDAFVDALAWAFAPSETFIQSKVEALIAKYPTAETFSHLGHSFRSFFDGLGAQPPIIYIDLGASEGDYNYGGRMAFIDLTWYARYKPTVDAILGAFIWLWVAWRFFVSIPGIISGAPGIFGSPNEKPDVEFHAPRFEVGKNWLNSGSSYHKKGDGGGV